MSRTCYWTECQVPVPDAMLMCRKHWFTTPKDLRDKVWENYRSGQEDDLKVTEGYSAALREISRWIRDRQAARGDQARAKQLLLPI